MDDIKDLLKTIKVPKDGDSSKNHVIINPQLKDDDEKSNTNRTLAAKTISAKLSARFKVAEGVLPPKVSTMTDKKTAVRHVNRRYVPAHSVQRTLQGRALPTAGIQASSTRNESSDYDFHDQYKDRKAAHDAAKDLKSKGHETKIFKHSGASTVPGKGITPFVYWTVRKKKTEVNEMKTQDSQGFPQGPVDDAPEDPAKFGRSLASKSMATLKQDLSYALANKDASGQSVEPDGPVQDQLLGAPYNKGKDLSVDDLDVINKEIGVKLDA